MENYFEHPFSFTQEDVINFAEASGDKNPVHLDEDFAKSTIFKRRILHGFLGGSVFSKVFGTISPGYGTIYLSQSMFFYRPMYTNTNYIASFEVLEIKKDKNRARISTKIKDLEGNLIIGGEALIQHESIK